MICESKHYGQRDPYAPESAICVQFPPERKAATLPPVCTVASTVTGASFLARLADSGSAGADNLHRARPGPADASPGPRRPSAGPGTGAAWRSQRAAVRRILTGRRTSAPPGCARLRRGAGPRRDGSAQKLAPRAGRHKPLTAARGIRVLAPPGHTAPPYGSQLLEADLIVLKSSAADHMQMRQQPR